MINLYRVNHDEHRLSIHEENNRLVFTLRHYHPAWGNSYLEFKTTEVQLKEFSNLINQILNKKKG